jgi:hypothetical protein
LREVVGVLAHVERADEQGPGRFQARDQRRVGHSRRAIAVDLGAGARPQSSDVEQVLDGEGRARERPQARSAPARGVDGVGLGESARRGNVGEGAERAIASLDAAQGLLHDLARACGASPDRGRDSLSRSVEKRRRHGVNTGAGCS